MSTSPSVRCSERCRNIPDLVLLFVRVPTVSPDLLSFATTAAVINAGKTWRPTILVHHPVTALIISPPLCGLQWVRFPPGCDVHPSASPCSFKSIRNTLSTSLDAAQCQNDSTGALEAFLRILHI